MTAPITLGLIDDHQIVIDGLLSLLKNQDEIRVAFATTHPADALDLLREHPVDIVVMDMAMPGMSGGQLAPLISRSFPRVRILVLSMSGQGMEVNELINQADISGYALKNIGKEDFVAAIKKIAAGGIYYSEEVLQELEKAASMRQAKAESRLTDREVDVLKLIEREYSNKQIAEALFISERTVETHRKNMFRKTGAASVLGLIRYGREQGLLPT